MTDSRWGSVGVRLFFVLSGFLITGILLNARSQADAYGGSRLTVWRAFYCRRALRIFPLAYLALLTAWVAGVPSMRAHPWYYLTYSSNYLDVQAGFPDRSLDHFWSLAIEEQFYIVWPLLLLVSPKRWLPVTMAAVAVLSCFARAEFFDNGEYLSAYILTPSRLDALAIGGLLAWWQARRPDRTTATVIVLCVAAVGVRTAPMLFPEALISFALPELAYVLRSAALVIWAAKGIGGAIGWALSTKPAVFIGTISYVIYVYHMVIAGVTVLVTARLGITNPYPPDLGWQRLIWMIGTTLPVATLSWYFFEQPLNDLKHRFPYLKPTALNERALASTRPTAATTAQSRP
jgi:peptidoglycan/LPS O-acetylase OafA/YrhL